MSFDESYDEALYAEFCSRARTRRLPQPHRRAPGRRAPFTGAARAGRGGRGGRSRGAEGVRPLSHRRRRGGRRTGLCRRRCLPRWHGQLLHGEPGRGAPGGDLEPRPTSPWPPRRTRRPVPRRRRGSSAAVTSASFASLSGSPTQGNAPFEWLTAATAPRLPSRLLRWPTSRSAARRARALPRARAAPAPGGATGTGWSCPAAGSDPGLTCILDNLLGAVGSLPGGSAEHARRDSHPP